MVSTGASSTLTALVFSILVQQPVSSLYFTPLYSVIGFPLLSEIGF
jgi:hypothetical protein